VSSSIFLPIVGNVEKSRLQRESRRTPALRPPSHLPISIIVSRLWLERIEQMLAASRLMTLPSATRPRSHVSIRASHCIS
jgi:hypothetical protein